MSLTGLAAGPIIGVYGFLLVGHPPDNSCCTTSTANPTSQACKDNNKRSRSNMLWWNRKQSYPTENASGPG